MNVRKFHSRISQRETFQWNRFYIMEKEQKEGRENRKKGWMGKRRERETMNLEEKKTREVSTFTNDDALYF